MTIQEAERRASDIDQRFHDAHDRRYDCRTWETWETVERDWERKPRPVTWAGCREHHIALAQS